MDSTKREDDGIASVLTQLLQLLNSGTRTYDGQQLWTLCDTFAAIDSDGSGTIDQGEFTKAIQRLGVGITAPMTETLWTRVDVDASGTIEWGEFVLAFELGLGGMVERKAIGPFERGPSPQTLAEYEQIVESLLGGGIEVSGEEVRSLAAMFDAADTDHGGTLDRDEFERLVNAVADQVQLSVAQAAGNASSAAVAFFDQVIQLRRQGAASDGKEGIDRDEFCRSFHWATGGRAKRPRSDRRWQRVETGAPKPKPKSLAAVVTTPPSAAAEVAWGGPSTAMSTAIVTDASGSMPGRRRRGPASPLHVAVSTGKGSDVVHTLMHSGGAHHGREWAAARDRRGRTALHLVATSQSYSDATQLAVVTSLLASCPDIAAAQDCWGMTPLHCSVDTGCTLAVVRRIAQGPSGAAACALTTRTFGTAPLHIAVGRRNAGAGDAASSAAHRSRTGGVDERFYAIIRAHTAVDSGSLERSLIAARNSDAKFRQSPESWTVRALLGEEGDPLRSRRCSALAMKDVHGSTPIHHAVLYHAPIDVLWLLLSAARLHAPAAIAAVDENGNTVLHVAAEAMVSVATVRLLLAYRPSNGWVAQNNASGKSALQLAQRALSKHSTAHAHSVVEVIKMSAKEVVSDGANFVTAIARRGSSAVTATQLAKLMTPRSASAVLPAFSPKRKTVRLDDEGVAMQQLRLRSSIKETLAKRGGTLTLDSTSALISWGATTATATALGSNTLSVAAQEALRHEVAGGRAGVNGRLGKRSFGLRSRVVISASDADGFEGEGEEEGTAGTAEYARAVLGRGSSLGRWVAL